MTPPSPALSLDDVTLMLDALARERDPQAVFHVFDGIAQRLLGHKLLTVMRHLEASAEVERVYSSNPRAYPVGGRKSKQGTSWGTQVLDHGQVFIARNPGELRAAFPDYELILSLGIGSIMNVPVMHAGKCLGIANFSHDAGRYGEAQIPTGKILGELLAPLLR